MRLLMILGFVGFAATVAASANSTAATAEPICGQEIAADAEVPEKLSKLAAMEKHSKR